MELSVLEYANLVGLTRFGVIKQINEGRLPAGVSVKRVGKYYIITALKRPGKPVKRKKAVAAWTGYSTWNMIKTVCSRCSEKLEENRIGKRRYCLACHNEYMRLYRPAYSSFGDEQKKKATSRSIARVAAKRGTIQKQPCEVCGSGKSQMHHDDYNKPKEVRWFCRKHHLEWHKTNVAIN